MSLLSASFSRFTDKMIAHLLSVKPNMCGKNFEVKIQDVLFVGHPVSLNIKAKEASLLSFNIAFVLQVSVS